MNGNETNEEIYFLYPDEDEIKAAQLACCGRCCDACETPAEYAWRKRGVDMAILLESAIENELSENERQMIREKWFDGLTPLEIAKKNGVGKSNVSMTLVRAQEKLRHALSYAVRYQHMLADESALPLILGRARVIAAARNYSGESFHERIRSLRLAQNISKSSLCRASGVAARRISLIEKGETEPVINEIIALSEFFGVSADYIIKGENNGR